MDSELIQDLSIEMLGPSLTLLQKGFYLINRKKRLYTHPYQYDRFLTNRVFKSKHPMTYYASIGEGDWVASWISRLNEQSLRINKKSPMIDKIVIMHINQEYALKLEGLNVLRPGFTQRMLSNIETINNSVSQWSSKVQIITRQWNTGIPMFHGHIIDNWSLIGFWLANEKGHLHVKTSLDVYHKSVDEPYFNMIIRAFDNIWVGSLEREV